MRQHLRRDDRITIRGQWGTVLDVLTRRPGAGGNIFVRMDGASHASWHYAAEIDARAVTEALEATS